jgi:DNA-directed RNA polymerase subunit RPC12/RpoP
MKNFIKKKEDFVCGNCGFEVKGDGYTDHCPKCLWGKHVDEEIPGDRASDCGGLMKPVESSYVSGKFKIHYKCSKCRHGFWVREGRGDNRELLMGLMVK